MHTKYLVNRVKLSRMGVLTGLRKLACARGVSGASRMSKREIIDAILGGNDAVVVRVSGDGHEPREMASDSNGHVHPQSRWALESAAEAYRQKGGDPPTPKPEPKPEPTLPDPDDQPAPKPGAATVITEKAPAGGLEGALAGIIGEAVKSHIGDYLRKEGITKDAIDAIIDAAIAKKAVPRELRVKVGERPDVKVGITHPAFDDLVKMVAECRLDIYLHGPSASGKSFGAAQLAKVLQVEYCYIKCDAQMSTTVIDGVMSPINGEYYPSEFFHAYTQDPNSRYARGSLIFIDELDAAPADVTIGLNAALTDQAEYAFPHGVFKRGKNAYFVGTGNTLMTGADSKYNTRERQDAAFANRLSFLPWGYDKTFEDTVTDAYGAAFNVEPAVIKQWRKTVRRVRAACEKMRLDYVFALRQMQDGLRMIATGYSLAMVENIQIWAKVDPDDVDTIKANMGGA